MLNAHSIPYNPSGRAVGVFASFGIVLGVLNRFPWVLVSAVVRRCNRLHGNSRPAIPSRTVWQRVLTIADDAFVVPVGFLRLRPTPLFFASIRRVWVTQISAPPYCGFARPSGTSEFRICIYLTARCFGIEVSS